MCVVVAGTTHIILAAFALAVFSLAVCLFTQLLCVFVSWRCTLPCGPTLCLLLCLVTAMWTQADRRIVWRPLHPYTRQTYGCSFGLRNNGHPVLFHICFLRSFYNLSCAVGVPWRTHWQSVLQACWMGVTQTLANPCSLAHKVSSLATQVPYYMFLFDLNALLLATFGARSASRTVACQM